MAATSTVDTLGVNETFDAATASGVTFQQEVSNKVAGLILKLKGKHNVSQAAVDTVVQNISELLGSVQHRTRMAIADRHSVGLRDLSNFADLTDVYYNS